MVTMSGQTCCERSMSPSLLGDGRTIKVGKRKCFEKCSLQCYQWWHDEELVWILRLFSTFIQTTKGKQQTSITQYKMQIYLLPECWIRFVLWLEMKVSKSHVVRSYKYPSLSLCFTTNSSSCMDGNLICVLSCHSRTDRGTLYPLLWIWNQISFQRFLEC